MSGNPCPISAAAASLFTERARVGVTKYGTTLADAGLDRPRLLRLLAEELADALAYVTALQAATEQPAVTREAVVSAFLLHGPKDCADCGGDCIADKACTCAKQINAIMALIEGGAP